MSGLLDYRVFFILVFTCKYKFSSKSRAFRLIIAFTHRYTYRIRTHPDLVRELLDMMCWGVGLVVVEEGVNGCRTEGKVDGIDSKGLYIVKYKSCLHYLRSPIRAKE